MIIEKKILSQIYKNYYFLTGKIGLNTEYFISKIEEGLKKSNLHFQTNVKGFMTSWDYFNRDQEFLKLLYQIFDELETYKNIPGFDLDKAWGIREDLGHYTKPHAHDDCILSGVIYLNDHPQVLTLPEIKEKIKPEIGRFVIFSGFLTHSTTRNLMDISKYALVFNLKYKFF
jgi:hypothetical protein